MREAKDTNSIIFRVLYADEFPIQSNINLFKKIIDLNWNYVAINVCMFERYMTIRVHKCQWMMENVCLMG